MPEEEWLPVVGYEGLYQVSNQGRILSLLGTAPRVRQAQTTGSDLRHLQVRLFKNGSSKNRPVAHVVLEAFVGPRPDGMVCCHGPSGPEDNALANLVWGTPEKNQGEDRRRDGTHNGRPLLTEEVVRTIRTRYDAGVAKSVLAREFNVTPTHIHSIITRRIWKHI